MRWGLCLMALMMWAIWSTPAMAAPTAAEKATARGLVKSGRVKLRRGDVDAALRDLVAAHEIMGVPTTGVELGKAQERAGMLVEALDTLLAVTRMPKERREPRAFGKARAQAKKLTKPLAARVPSVRVMLSGHSADSATVAIDGKEISSELIGAAYKVNPGVHEIVASGDDGAVARAQVQLDEGDSREVSLTLEKPSAEPEPVAPAAESETHPLVWVGFGVGAAGAIVGAVTGGLSLSKHADVAPQCPNNQCPPETHDDIDTGKTLGTVSTIAFIVGGVGVAAGIVGLLLPYGGDGVASDAWLRVGPGGVTLGGNF